MEMFGYRGIGGQTLSSKVEMDNNLMELAELSDYAFDGTSSFVVPSFYIPSDFSLGVIYGPSGTGKSSLLSELGCIEEHTWDACKAVASQVDPNLLMRMGLSSIPSLCRPYHVLSTGEKHRSDIARSLKNNCVIDEFTSVCNRDLARSISVGVRKVIDHKGYRNVVLATCHEDVIEWLEPDWVANTITRRLVEGRSERQPIQFRLLPCSIEAWSAFRDHHYLSGDINKSSHCWVLADVRGTLCGFYAAIPLPGRDLKNAWRGHRLVIHPDFQGLGLGHRVNDAVAKMFYDKGCRFFVKTAHPKLGLYNENSPLWKPTSTNLVSRKSSYEGMSETKSSKGAYTSFDYLAHSKRLCYSHEYIGDGARTVLDSGGNPKGEYFFSV